MARRRAILETEWLVVGTLVHLSWMGFKAPPV